MSRFDRARLVLWLLMLCVTWGATPAWAADVEDTVTLVVRDSPVREVMEMLSKTEGLSIALSDNIEANVSVSLYDVSPEEAVRAVAQAAGYGVDVRDGTYVILEFDDVGQDFPNGVTEIRSFKIQYSETDKVREILEKHLSRHGEITALEGRRMIVVEDLPNFLDRLAGILEEIDRRPQQVLLEAKVLEVSLDKNDSLGIDWNRITEIEGTDFTIGTRGLTTGTAPGFFFNVMNENLDGAIEALTDEGRVRALASPQLLTMENEEAEVLVGERLGFRVTTTINQVTTESVEFIDSGVILRFKPSVDRQGRVLLEIHPEVSTGVITDGIPSVTTTEVTTQLLAENGERIFIGGLIRNSSTEGRRGVPFLSKIPLLGMLFSRSEWLKRSTETILIVRATVRGSPMDEAPDATAIRRLQQVEPGLEDERRSMENNLDLMPWKPKIDPGEDDEEPGPAKEAVQSEPDFDWDGDEQAVDQTAGLAPPAPVDAAPPESSPPPVPDPSLAYLAEGCLLEIYELDAPVGDLAVEWGREALPAASIASIDPSEASRTKETPIVEEPAPAPPAIADVPLPLPPDLAAPIEIERVVAAAIASKPTPTPRPETPRAAPIAEPLPRFRFIVSRVALRVLPPVERPVARARPPEVRPVATLPKLAGVRAALDPPAVSAPPPGSRDPRRDEPERQARRSRVFALLPDRPPRVARQKTVESGPPRPDGIRRPAAGASPPAPA